MASESHISETNLILFHDRELSGHETAAVEHHLETCSECRGRLNKLQRATAAYGEYRNTVLNAAIDTEPKQWPTLEHGFSRLDEQTREKHKPFLITFRWAAVFAILGILTACLYFFRPSREPHIEDLIARGEQVRTSPAQRLVFATSGHTWTRDARSRGANLKADSGDLEQHVHTLFVEANYSWEEPLSMHAYATWRQALRERRDRVTTLRDENGAKRFYRLRTETSASILRTVSLTMKADTAQTVRAAFQFQNEGDIDIAEGGAVEPGAAVRREPPPARERITETPATAEDELRVFAALNAIGADTEDPVEVSLLPSSTRVEVKATGLAKNRQKQITSALNGISRVHLSFASEQPSSSGVRDKADVFAPGMDSAYRKLLETRAGGVPEFETLSDRAIDTSNGLLSQAHALAMLSREFPRAVEIQLKPESRKTLDGLRRQHGLALKRHALALEVALKPVMPSDTIQSSSSETNSSPGTSWQDSATRAFREVQRVDALVSRVLGGKLAPGEGDGQLSAISDALARIERFGETQTNPGH